MDLPGFCYKKNYSYKPFGRKRELDVEQKIVLWENSEPTREVPAMFKENITGGKGGP